MTKDIVVIGAGGFGRETLDVIKSINTSAEEPVWNVVGVIDDAPTEIHIEQLKALGVPFLGGIPEIRQRIAGCHYVVGIGAPSIRARIANLMEQWGGRAATLVHPTVVIGSLTAIASGSVVCAGAQLSTNVHLGKHVHINPNATIGHDSTLGDSVSMNPGAIVSGNVSVGERALVGAGATVLQGLVVGADAVVGAAACVTKSVPAGITVIGVPARSYDTESNKLETLSIRTANE